MPIYAFRSTTMDGIIAQGAIEAPDEQSAIERIKNRGVIPLEVSLPKQRAAWRIRVKSSSGDLLAFTSELSVLLGAGLPLDRSLNILSEISENRRLRGIIGAVVKSVREGTSFSEALGRHPRSFPRFYVSMIRAATEPGTWA
jgi:general secretion pathway protein F